MLLIHFPHAHIMDNVTWGQDAEVPCCCERTVRREHNFIRRPYDSKCKIDILHIFIYLLPFFASAPAYKL